jgi:long-chain acyl-CoA synthetase
MTPDDVVLVLPPLFHVYGLNAGLGLAARVGATLVFTERFEPAATLKLIRERRVTCVVGAPTAFAAWSGLAGLRDAFTTARLVVSGGAPLPPELAERFAAASGRPVHQGYGLTETAPVLSTTLVGGTPKPGSIGRPLPGVELRLEDAQGSEVADDDPGEIVVRGANLFSGYWPDGAGGPDQAGWFHTGDVAYADEDGDLFLVDRLRDLIIVNGFNVYPQEVEQVLAAHPEVAEAAVVGAPDPYSGETVRAYVVPRPGSRPSAEALIEHAAATLARFKCPTSVEFRTHLPHSLAGEVAKRRLRAERPAEDDGG